VVAVDFAEADRPVEPIAASLSASTCSQAAGAAQPRPFQRRQHHAPAVALAALAAPVATSNRPARSPSCTQIASHRLLAAPQRRTARFRLDRADDLRQARPQRRLESCTVIAALMKRPCPSSGSGHRPSIAGIVERGQAHDQRFVEARPARPGRNSAVSCSPASGDMRKVSGRP
jgi:hypothetical protein